MSEKKSVNAIKQQNLDTFLEGGPRLTARYDVFVCAKNPAKGLVQLGGLGAMGVGRMWVTETEDHKHYPGYPDALDVSIQSDRNLKEES